MRTSDVLPRIIEMPTGEEKRINHAFEWTDVTNLQEDIDSADRTYLYFRGGGQILVEGKLTDHFRTWEEKKKHLEEIERFGNF